MTPSYWRQASAELAAADECMGELVERYAGLGLVSRGDPFATLARSIVGQQISVKAADSVWGRFVAALSDVSPQAVLFAGEDGLAGCGLSRRKREYVCDLAAHFVAGRLDPSDWAAMDDEALISALTEVRGIGRWTAADFWRALHHGRLQVSIGRDDPHGFTPVFSFWIVARKEAACVCGRAFAIFTGFVIDWQQVVAAGEYQRL